MRNSIMLLAGAILGSILNFGQLYAQDDFVGPKEKYETPPDSILSMTEYSPAPDADYIYALKQGDIHFEQNGESINARIDYVIRLKVLSEEGSKKAALVDIPYYFDRDIEQISNIWGITYQPDGSYTRLDSSRVRTINLSATYNVSEFTMPDVNKGSVIEYGYTVRRRYIEELPDFYFAHQVPTVLAQITLHNPQYLRYNVVPIRVKSRLQYEQNKIDTSSVPKIFTIPQPDPLLVEHWKARHIRAVEPLPYLPSLNEYRDRLKFQITEFGIPRQPLDNSWELVAAKIRRNQNPLDVLEQSDSSDVVARSIGRHFQDKKKAMDSLFRYVNERAAYNGTPSPYGDLSPITVLRGHSANQGAINQTLLKMLREAGIDKSWPVLVSTRKNGKINKEFPSPFQFNAMLVLTVINGNKYLMDASYPHSRPGLIPVEMNNEEGLVLKEKSFEWIDISPPYSHNKMQFAIKAQLKKDGELQGTIRGAAGGYPARLIREELHQGGAVKNILRDIFFQGYRSSRIDTVRVLNLENYREPLQLQIDFQINEYAQSFQSGLKYNPMIVGTLLENPFQQKDRDVPVVLDAPEYLRFKYDIELPRNTSLESMKRNQNMSIPNGHLAEVYQIERGRIKYAYEIILEDYRFSPDEYPQIRSLYERWVTLSSNMWFIRK